MPKVYVLYHNDLDGLAAASCLYLQYEENATYIQVQYNQPFPIELEKLDLDTIIYIVDFSYNNELINKLRELCYRVVVIDHHESAIEHLEPHQDTITDITKAGCVLTWEYLYPNEAIPKPILYTADRDLWLFNFPDTKAFYAGIQACPNGNTFHYWKLLLKLPMILDDIVAKGRICLAPLENMVNSFISGKKHRIILFEGYKTIFYSRQELISETADAFLDKYDADITLSYFMLTDGSAVFNLRSKGIPVNKIAKSIDSNGGGHVKAAGFKIPAPRSFEYLRNLYGQSSLESQTC